MVPSNTWRRSCKVVNRDVAVIYSPTSQNRILFHFTADLEVKVVLEHRVFFLVEWFSTHRAGHANECSWTSLFRWLGALTDRQKGCSAKWKQYMCPCQSQILCFTEISSLVLSNISLHDPFHSAWSVQTGVIGSNCVFFFVDKRNLKSQRSPTCAPVLTCEKDEMKTEKCCIHSCR